jgi:hypothetical protein
MKLLPARWTKPKRRRSKKRRPPLFDAAARETIVRFVLRGAIVGIVVVGAVWGVWSMESSVRSNPAYGRPPEVVLADAPEGLADQIMEVIAPEADRAWTDPNLCRDVADALSRSPWVERVLSVRRHTDATLVVSCAYRSAAALVQVGGAFYLIAEDGIRLPGSYGYDPSLVVIQGVGAVPPEAGVRWTGEDVRAGLDLIKRLRDEPYFGQVTGVIVSNYGGRESKRDPHIELATAPSGSRIAWGSAPGEEIEENTVDEKIALLWENYRRWGRIDAGRDAIDISTYPDRFTTRTPDRG